MVHFSAPDWVRMLYPAAVFSFMHWFNMAPYVPLGARNFVVTVISTFVLLALAMKIAMGHSFCAGDGRGVSRCPCGTYLARQS